MKQIMTVEDSFSKKAFGYEFEPHLDKDAVIKFILNSLLMDRDLGRLVELLDISLNVGGIEGEPGWELEKLKIRIEVCRAMLNGLSGHIIERQLIQLSMS